MLSGLFYHNSLDWSISGLVFITTMFTEIPVLNAISVDPDQMQHSALAVCTVCDNYLFGG